MVTPPPLSSLLKAQQYLHRYREAVPYSGGHLHSLTCADGVKRRGNAVPIKCITGGWWHVHFSARTAPAFEFWEPALQTAAGSTVLPRFTYYLFPQHQAPPVPRHIFSFIRWNGRTIWQSTETQPQDSLGYAHVEKTPWRGIAQYSESLEKWGYLLSCGIVVFQRDLCDIKVPH